MNYKEWLLKNFECAINAVLGDWADESINTADDLIDENDIQAIADKVKFYIGK